MISWHFLSPLILKVGTGDAPGDTFTIWRCHLRLLTKSNLRFFKWYFIPNVGAYSHPPSFVNFSIRFFISSCASCFRSRVRIQRLRRQKWYDLNTDPQPPAVASTQYSQPTKFNQFYYYYRLEKLVYFQTVPKIRLFLYLAHENGEVLYKLEFELHESRLDGIVQLLSEP